MKRTTAEWTVIQGYLVTGTVRERQIEQWIDHRTDGKVWSQTVAIGLHKADEALVLAAEDMAIAAGKLKPR